MDWNVWKPIYDDIVRDFGFDADADREARDTLRDLLGERISVLEPAQMRAWSAGRDRFRAAMGRGEVWVVGPAASAQALARIPPDVAVVVTDGAAHRVLALIPMPAAIVTDLDGDVEAQWAANARGVPLFVHAHGDNLESLRTWVPRAQGPVYGTTQTGPLPPVWNHGGFTDGDRACCIAVAFGAPSLALVGFDFDRPVAKGDRDAETKRRKLAWAKRIIEKLPVPVRYV